MVGEYQQIPGIAEFTVRILLQSTVSAGRRGLEFSVTAPARGGGNLTGVGASRCGGGVGGGGRGGGAGEGGRSGG